MIEIPDMVTDDTPDIKWLVDKYPHLFTYENLWDPRESISHRFDGMDGKILWDILVVYYVKHQKKQFRILKSGIGALLRRSCLNDRDEQGPKDDYKASIKVHGLRQEARSQAIVVECREFPLDEEMRDVLAGAHCTDALIEAWNEGQSIKCGLWAIEIKKETPEDIQRWCVTAFNLFNDGAGFSPSQFINLRLRLKDRWNEFRESQTPKITVGSCGGQAQYEAVHREWLHKHSKDKIFGDDWPLYNRAGVFINSLCDRDPKNPSIILNSGKRLDEFQELLKKYFDNRTLKMPLDVCFRNFDSLDQLLSKHYKKHMDHDKYIILWEECMKCCIPLNGSLTGGYEFCHLDWLPQRISLLATEMVNAKKVVLKVRKAKAKATSKAKAKATAKCSAKAKAKAAKAKVKAMAAKTAKAKAKAVKAKANACASVTQDEEQLAELDDDQDQEEPDVDDHSQDEGRDADGAVENVEDDAVDALPAEVVLDSKEAQWVDDFNAVVEKASSSITARGLVFHKLFNSAYRYCLRKGLHLVWKKKCNWQYENGNDELESDAKNTDAVDVTSWRVLKKKIFLAIAKRCAQHVKGLLSESSDKLKQEEAICLAQLPPTNFLELREFIANLSTSQRVRFHAPYRTVASAVKQTLEVQAAREQREDDQGGETKVDENSVSYFRQVVTTCSDEVDAVLKPEWVWALSAALDGPEGVTANVAALFPSEDAVRNALVPPQAAQTAPLCGECEELAADDKNNNTVDNGANPRNGVETEEPAKKKAKLPQFGKKVDYEKMLYVSSLRCNYLFNLLQEMTMGTIHCSPTSCIDTLLRDPEHDFWLELAGRETSHVLQSRRITFWTALWQRLNECNPNGDPLICIDAADCIVKGKPIREDEEDRLEDNAIVAGDEPQVAGAATSGPRLNRLTAMQQCNAPQCKAQCNNNNAHSTVVQ